MKDRKDALIFSLKFCLMHHLAGSEVEVVRHKKTGNYYVMYKRIVLECTNGQEDVHKILYTDGKKLFCREEKEFSQKFEPAEESEPM